ncbi:hypothetical protein AAHA92_07467 [Salvia divinorum]|uniref:Pentatricopeptide repeat-containing protein n=1 Tax=Salvia divinorum TaxID=28513 RepID=A0ABD1IBZ3_SALDI
MGGMEPDSYSCDELLRGFCEADRIDKAYVVLVNKMEVKRYADVVSYNTIITALCRSGVTRKAYKLFEEMEFNVVPLMKSQLQSFWDWVVKGARYLLRWVWTGDHILLCSDAGDICLHPYS